MQTAWYLIDIVYLVALWSTHLVLIFAAAWFAFDCRQLGLVVSPEFGSRHYRPKACQLMTLLAISGIGGLLLTPLLSNQSVAGIASAIIFVPLAALNLMQHLRRRDLDSAILMILVAILAGFVAYMHLQTVM